MDSLSNIISKILTPIVTLVTACLAAYLSFWVEPKQKEQSQILQEKIVEVDSVVKQSEQALKELKQRREVEWKVYEEVLDSLGESKKHQEAAKSLVVVMVEDARLRGSLLALFEQSNIKDVADDARAIRVSENKFQKEDEAIASRDLSSRNKIASDHEWGEWDFDVLWCESSFRNNKAEANLIAKEIKNSTNTTGFVRVRKIPATKLSTSSFSHFGYKIYWDIEEEREKDLLVEIVSKVLGSEKSEYLEVEPNMDAASPWYLSVFVCPVGGNL
ncbi:hypothetical protein ACPV5O_05035 [Vibrio maritimus]|uniref:hypothetical protein n=1 Tax=Vibrio maritimus TaxID=990268 RepID=UPI004067AE02